MMASGDKGKVLGLMHLATLLVQEPDRKASD